jgi:hypothetical protein
LESPLHGSISEEQATRLISLFSRSKPTALEIIEGGRLLIDVEKQRSPKWVEWRRTHIGRSRRKYQQWRAAARFADRFGDDSRLRNLPQNLLYCLASPSLSNETLEETLEICRLIRQRVLTELSIEQRVANELEAQGLTIRRRVRYDQIGELDLVVEGEAVIEVELFLKRSVLYHAIGQTLVYRQVHDPRLKAVVVGLPHPDCPADSSFFRAAKELGVQIWLLRPPSFSIPNAW